MLPCPAWPRHISPLWRCMPSDLMDSYLSPADEAAQQAPGVPHGHARNPRQPTPQRVCQFSDALPGGTRPDVQRLPHRHAQSHLPSCRDPSYSFLSKLLFALIGGIRPNIQRLPARHTQPHLKYSKFGLSTNDFLQFLTPSRSHPPTSSACRSASFNPA